MLRRSRYRVLLAREGGEALEAYNNDPKGIDAVLTDVMMPGMDGSEFVQQLWRAFPEARVVAMTGLGEEARLDHLAGIGVRRVLEKPFTIDQLLRAIHETLEEPVVSR
jgi:CheY-like chemotaxis protein